MKNKIVQYGLIFSILGTIVGICIVVYMFNKPKRDVANSKVAYTITASQLVAEFTKNEEAANAKYLSAAYGNVIQISGEVKEINLVGDTLLNLSLSGSSADAGAVNCSLEKSELAKSKHVKPGDSVVVKGECTGYMDITNEVTLIKCTLVDVK